MVAYELVPKKSKHLTRASATSHFSPFISAASLPPIRARRKGVHGFSVETAGSGKYPFSPSSDSLALLGHPLCTNFVIPKISVDYVMHSSFAYRQFNSNFKCVDPTILP
ncbi:hypothetical protein AVEN_32404-1 [Araneus ventricosus]|uniref:Uncharacterized protein n=1 Tax=Araneus ventricosus TaxID=182803 RepID=A0A4Y2IWW6_ARAVE|nr:hypothetical protein AVEN_32404-1 [Araneus ventricosus]